MEEDKKRPEIEDMVPAVFTLPDGTTQQAEERRCRVCGRISHNGDKWCVCRCKRCWQHADPALSRGTTMTGCDCDAKIREATYEDIERLTPPRKPRVKKEKRTEDVKKEA